jgi:hypothetical protein
MLSSLPTVAGRRLVAPQQVALQPAAQRLEQVLLPLVDSPVVLLRPALSPAHMPFRLRQRA